MFWIFLLFSIMSLVGIYTISALLLDSYMLVKGRRILAKVTRLEVIEKPISNLENYRLFNLEIRYSYFINNKEYTSSCINAFFDFTREEKLDILNSLQIIDNQIEIYVLKSFPKISMTSPLKVNKKLLSIATMIGIFFPSILGYLLIKNKNIFYFLLNTPYLEIAIN